MQVRTQALNLPFVRPLHFLLHTATLGRRRLLRFAICVSSSWWVVTCGDGGVDQRSWHAARSAYDPCST